MRVTVSGASENDHLKALREIEEKLLLDLHGGLVLATPVDTGRARAGWTVDTTALVIENNVEYIGKLNEGHSKQAPAGFVETEIDKIKLR